jgi:putative transposase
VDAGASGYISRAERHEFLNVQVFWGLPDLRGAADAGLIDYNEVRPHSSLNYLTPKEFAEKP